MRDLLADDTDYRLVDAISKADVLGDTQGNAGDMTFDYPTLQSGAITDFFLVEAVNGVPSLPSSGYRLMVSDQHSFTSEGPDLGAYAGVGILPNPTAAASPVTIGELTTLGDLHLNATNITSRGTELRAVPHVTPARKVQPVGYVDQDEKERIRDHYIARKAGLALAIAAALAEACLDSIFIQTFAAIGIIDDPCTIPIFFPGYIRSTMLTVRI
ncbi:MAG: hypothetical protein GEV08_08870 [Acidimicrobiia bacterium]|nr:hypothetical protein [Acidimicrobiia bacterium]